MQFLPPDDEPMFSKHVEEWNKLIVKQKFCAWIRVITDKNENEKYHNRIATYTGAYNSNILLQTHKWPRLQPT